MMTADPRLTATPRDSEPTTCVKRLKSANVSLPTAAGQVPTQTGRACSYFARQDESLS